MACSGTRVSKTARALLALLVASTVPALPRAGMFDDDEARRRIEVLRGDHERSVSETRERLARLEESIRNIGVVDLLRQLEILNAEVARLRGQIELLGHQNEQVQKRQRDFYLDLDSRLKRLESPGAAQAQPGAPTATAPTKAAAVPAAPVPAASPPAAAAPPAPASAAASAAASPTDTTAYQAAFDTFRKNDFPAAADAFRQFLRDHPASVLAPNAGYWLGISLANQKNLRGALAAQQDVVARFPKSPKAPDALLAIASLQSELGDPGSARDTLEDVIAKYPGSEAAGKARARLPQARR